MTAQIRDRVFRAEAVDQSLQGDQLAVTTLVAANVDTVVVVPDILEGGGDVSLAGSIHGRGYINSPLLLPQDQWLFLAFARFRCGGKAVSSVAVMLPSGKRGKVMRIMILKRLSAILIVAIILTTGAQAQTVAPYPPLVTDMAAHLEAYNRVNNPQAGLSVNKVAQKPVKPAARTSRYAKLLKTENDQDWKINSKVVTSIGMGLAAAIALGLAAILGDDDDTSTSSTSTTTSTTE